MLLFNSCAESAVVLVLFGEIRGICAYGCCYYFSPSDPPQAIEDLRLDTILVQHFKVDVWCNNIWMDGQKTLLRTPVP